ncbi:MAG: SRPBCC domain-containing protein [Dehalococcoidia bacterium]
MPEHHEPDHVAEARTTIQAPAAQVWEALTNPTLVSAYFFGTELETDWRVGSPMTFRGNWEGRQYEDLGTVIAFEPPRHLAYSHWSPLSGEPDTPETRHRLDFALEERDGATAVTLRQDHNPTVDARRHAEEQWAGVLDGLRQVAEGTGAHTEPQVVDGGTDRDVEPPGDASA